MCLLAMLAGAAAVSPLKLISGGLGLAQTPEGAWLLRQSWPGLLGKVAAASVIQQAAMTTGFVIIKKLLGRAGFPAAGPAAAAAVGACFLCCLLATGHALMQAAPLLTIQWALLYAYARTATLMVPCAAGLMLTLASLYSARMLVLLRADLGSLDALTDIPAAWGVLAVSGAGAVLFAALGGGRLAPWRRLESLGSWWKTPADLPKSPLALFPLGLLWGLALYLSSYLVYHAIFFLAPAGESVPPMLKQTLLMPLDMLVYLFFISAALEELIFRAGLFRALDRRMPGFWPAALLSSAVFSGIHFVDLNFVLGFLGVNVSRLIESLLMVYGFSWAGFGGRVAAGLLLAILYRRSGVLLIPILAHFTSNLLEAIGLRFGLAWLLAATAGIFALQFAEPEGT